MSKPLLDRLRKAARHNGQSLRFVLEKAVSQYLDGAPAAPVAIRPEVLRAIEASFVEHEELIRRLA